MPKKATTGKKIRKINRVKAVLAEEGVQQKELAERTGLTPNSITRICNNLSQPTLPHLLDIANALEVNIQRLLIPTENKRAKK